MHRLRFAEEVMRECTTVLDRMDDDSKVQDVPQYPKKWYPERKRQGIKLSPEKFRLSPEETFPVSPVAMLLRPP